MFRVGKRYQYSNLGIDLAGFTLQNASGRPFSDYIRDEVLAPSPAGMRLDPRHPSHDRGKRRLFHCPRYRHAPQLHVEERHPRRADFQPIPVRRDGHHAQPRRLRPGSGDGQAAADLVAASFPLTYLPVCSIELGRVKDNGWYLDAHPEGTA